MAWNRTFTLPANFNNNNAFDVNSVLTPNMFNVPYQNTLYLYDQLSEIETHYVEGDQKSLYNLGAYDSVATANGITTIIRQTGYLNIDKEKLTYYDSNNKQRWVICNLLGKTTVPSVNTEIGKIVSNNYETKTEANAWETNSGMSLNTSGDLVIYSTARPNGVIQYKLATSYQEQVIENQPLNTLDQNESQIVKEEVEKSLNLSSNALSSYTLNQSGNLFLRGWVSPYVSQLFNQSASTSATSIEKTFTISTATKVRFQFGSDSGENTNFDQDLQAGTYTIKIATSVSNSVLTVSSIMLVECDHAYPYVPYNANKHITNEQAELLKDEYLKSSNLLSIADKGSTTTNGITYSIQNGKITLNGTANANFNLVISEDLTTNLVVGNTYSYNGFVTNNNPFSTIRLTRNGETTYPTAFTYQSGDIVRLQVYIASGNSFTNATATPMLVLGTTIPTTFEPYHGEIVHKKTIDEINARLDDLGFKEASFTIYIDVAPEGVSPNINKISKQGNMCNVNFDIGGTQDVVVFSKTGRIACDINQFAPKSDRTDAVLCSVLIQNIGLGTTYYGTKRLTMNTAGNIVYDFSELTQYETIRRITIMGGYRRNDD